MHTSAASPVLALAAALTALGVFAAPAVAESTNIPTNAYYDRSLTSDEKAAIREEEAVTPNDGKASVPAPGDQGVIPDAADAAVPLPTAKANADKPGQKKTAETEAEVILDDSKKVDPVTKKDFDECMQAWGPQTQMSKAEFAASCRTTLQYFPEKD
jgi:hypothetical protein